MNVASSMYKQKAAFMTGTSYVLEARFTVVGVWAKMTMQYRDLLEMKNLCPYQRIHIHLHDLYASSDRRSTSEEHPNASLRWTCKEIPRTLLIPATSFGATTSMHMREMRADLCSSNLTFDQSPYAY